MSKPALPNEVIVFILQYLLIAKERIIDIVPTSDLEEKFVHASTETLTSEEPVTGQGHRLLANEEKTCEPEQQQVIGQGLQYKHQPRRFKSKEPVHGQVLRTCTRFYVLGVSFLYSDNTFRFPTHYAFRDFFLLQIGRRERRLINQVTISMRFKIGEDTKLYPSIERYCRQLLGDVEIKREPQAIGSFIALFQFAVVSVVRSDQGSRDWKSMKQKKKFTLVRNESGRVIWKISEFDRMAKQFSRLKIKD